eukprot:1139191-Pelagomonas_calceolata.AAC.1
MPATSTPTVSCEQELSIGLIKLGVRGEMGPQDLAVGIQLTAQVPATSTPTDSCEQELSIGLLKLDVRAETGPQQALKVKC